MIDPDRWALLMGRKCNCFQSEREPVEGLHDTTRCTTCGKWWNLHVSNDNTIAKLLAAFPPKDDK